MKTTFLLLLTSLIYVNSYAQFGAQQIITTNADGAYTVHTSDIDGDGDMDVLSSSTIDDKVEWYENTDGLGTFGVPQIIADNVDGAFSVYTADLDGDGDMDVLSASSYDNTITWHKNTDGQGNFSFQQDITTNAVYVLQVYAADLDGDGDMDVLSASRYDDKIAWYKNTDGLGAFGPLQIITTNAIEAFSVYAADIDGDGDMDVISASFNDDKIAWYENTNGQGLFGTQQIITTMADGPRYVYAIDIDGDGDMDVLSASYWDNKIAWYENTDGQGSFVQNIITTIAFGANNVHAADLDGDGDIDVLSASWNNQIAWYENTDGQGTFGALQIITTMVDVPGSVYTSDIDSDGAMDVLTASGSDYKVAWYKNESTLFVNEINSSDFFVYPIPTTGIVSVKSKMTISQIEIYNETGQLVLSNNNENTIDLSSLSNGIYIMKIIDGYGNSIFERAVKK